MNHDTNRFLKKLNPSENVHMPVIGVLIGCISSGVDIISNEPVEIFVAASTDYFISLWMMYTPSSLKSPRIVMF